MWTGARNSDRASLDFRFGRKAEALSVGMESSSARAGEARRRHTACAVTSCVSSSFVAHADRSRRRHPRGRIGGRMRQPRIAARHRHLDDAPTREHGSDRIA
jgi:hypothetical protein